MDEDRKLFGKSNVTLSNGKSLPNDLVRDAKRAFEELISEFDDDGNGKITSNELGAILEKLGESVPGYKLREMIAEVDQDRNGIVEFDEFLELYSNITTKGVFGEWTSLVSPRQGIKVAGGTSKASAIGTAHTSSDSEQVAFNDWLTSQLIDDPDCSTYLPINSPDMLVKSLRDGVMLCKMINLSAPKTIDERTINKGNLNAFRITENNILVLNSASSIGCTVVNIGSEDIAHAKEHLVLGLLWQIIRIGLFANITLQANPNITALLEDGETLEDLLKLSPEELLLRWVNYHLKRAGSDTRIRNFSSDIKDAEAYAILLYQISPQEFSVDRAEQMLSPDDSLRRADYVLKNAEKIDCRRFVTSRDIVNGNGKLNLAFVANLFNKYPALDNTDFDNLAMEGHVETREEKTYRCWMNSLGVAPFVYHLFNDLSSGLVLFQLYDDIRRGTVNWDKVNQKFKSFKTKMQKIENCNYVMELGLQNKYSLVGIGGEDIHNGNRTLVLALLWQMLRDYIARSLGGVKDSEIVEWVNKTLKNKLKSSFIANFRDPVISTSIPVIDLVDAIKPNSIDYDLVTNGETEEEQALNAQYAISMCRKIGARTYALPEDLVEVKPKMVLTVFACLMTRGLQKK